MTTSQFPYTSATIPKMDCNKEFCVLMYKSHKDTLTKFQNLEQLHSTLQTRYSQLLDHRVTSGTVDAQNQAVLPNGETLSVEMFMQRTRMFEQNRTVMERMQKELASQQKENATTKAQLDKKSQQAREFETRLNGFQRAQTYTYTNEQHRAAAQANEENEKLIRSLQRENDKLKSQNAELIHRTNFTPCETVDNQSNPKPTVPLTCPYGECTHYNNTIIGSTNPAKLYNNHLARHRCQYCLDLVCGPKSKHEQHCIANPVAVAGTIPKKTKTANRDCRFCSTAVDNTDEHEDICAPSHISRYMCPCTEDGVDCLYFSIDAHRAQHHARRSNRRKVDENDPFKCPLRDPLLKPMPEDIDEIIVQRL